MIEGLHYIFQYVQYYIDGKSTQVYGSTQEVHKYTVYSTSISL